MLDKNGTTIVQTTKLYGKAGAKMVCLGYRGIDGRIILCQDNSGEFPIHLTQEQLLTTHIWVVDLNLTLQNAKLDAEINEFIYGEWVWADLYGSSIKDCPDNPNESCFTKVWLPK